MQKTISTFSTLLLIYVLMEFPKNSENKFLKHNTPDFPQISSFRFMNSTQLVSAGNGHLTLSVPPWVFELDRGANGSYNRDEEVQAALLNPNNFKAQDKEDYYALQHFFNSQVQEGLILESGALDGLQLSTSWMFEKTLGWRAIHIEANPRSYEDLVRNRPDALNINVALCREPQTLHLAYDEEKRAVGGIWEFMPEEFKKLWWKEIKSEESLPTVGCMPLAPLLLLFDISHVNFWVLDVEGAELEVLQATDFERVTFDVIAMETLGMDEERDFAAISFLNSKGYITFSKVGRNTWLVSEKMALIAKQIKKV